MDLTALVDLLAQRVAEEINTVRAEMLALVMGSPTNAYSTGLVAFSGGDATLSPNTPIVDGGSA